MAQSPKFKPVMDMKPFVPQEPCCQYDVSCRAAPEVTARFLLKLEDGRIRTHGIPVDFCKEHAEMERARWEQV